MPARSSIVVVNFNGKLPLRAMLTALRWNEAPVGELIVVDNASFDGSAEMVKTDFPFVKLLKLDRNRGFTAAAAIGAKEATGDCLVICHADILATIHQLTELTDRLTATSRAGMVVPRLRGVDGAEQPMIGRLPTFGSALAGVVHPAGMRRCETASLDHVPDHQWASLACAAFDCDALMKAGGLDAGYFLGFGDADVCARLHDRGLRILVHPSVTVTHAGAAPGHESAGHQRRLLRKDLRRYADRHFAAWQGKVIGFVDDLRAKIQKDE